MKCPETMEQPASDVLGALARAASATASATSATVSTTPSATTSATPSKSVTTTAGLAAPAGPATQCVAAPNGTRLGRLRRLATMPILGIRQRSTIKEATSANSVRLELPATEPRLVGGVELGGSDAELLAAAERQIIELRKRVSELELQREREVPKLVGGDLGGSDSEHVAALVQRVTELER